MSCARARAAPHRAAEADQRQHDHRDGGEHEQRQPRAGHHHHGGGADEQHEVAQRDRHRAPTAALIWVVSAVSREMISPVLAVRRRRATAR